MNIDEVTKKANELFGNKEKLELEDLRRLFGNEGSLSTQVQYNEVNEYLKSIILNQINLYEVLQKSCNTTFDQQMHGGQECKDNVDIREKTIYEKLDSQGNQMLDFNSEIIKNLFGDNDLGIRTKEEAEYCYKFNRAGKQSSMCMDICREEIQKKSYEDTKNPIKRIVGYIKNKSLQKKGKLEDRFIKNAREFVASEIKKGNISMGMLPSLVGHRFQKCAEQYDESRIVLALAHMSIKSLQKSDKKINIIDEAYSARDAMQPYISDMMEEGIREDEVDLGEFQPIDHKEVKMAMDKLQQRFDNLSTDSDISQKQYIEECSEIFADFIWIQPFNDGNKRTALYVLNQMFLSKGIIPPLLSVARDSDFTKSISKTQNKDYTDLKEIITLEVSKMNPDIHIGTDNQEQLREEDKSIGNNDINR